MSLDNILRLSYWTDSAVTAERAGPAMILAVLAGLVFAIVAGRRLRQPAQRWPLVAAGALIAAVAAGRLLAVPVLGWRLGWLVAGLTIAAVAGATLARWAWQDGVPAACASAAGFLAPSKPARWRWPVAAAWLGLHSVALAACFVSIRLPAAYGLAAVGVVAATGLIGARSRAGLAALAPLTAAELMLVARGLAAALAGVRIDEAIPQPWEAALNLPLATWTACGLALAAALRMVSQRFAIPFARAGALALIAGSVAWTVWLGATLTTRGVTGSDPYAYAQMGVDLATRGTVFHPFPLIRITYDLGIPSEPITHVGYREPRDVRREAPTVWPPGYALFTGAAYALLGEAGLYAITPALGAAALLLVALLSLKAAGRGARGWAVAALTVALTATSYQQVEWQLIPMADLASQVLSLGALTLGLMSGGRRGRWAALAAGLAIGAAFGVRYTQVLIAGGVALAIWLSGAGDRRERLFRALVAAVGAALAALPTLAYHANAFGSPFATGSDELQHFSLAGMPATLGRLIGELAWYREFGLLAPLAAAGAIWLARARRPAAAALAAFAVPVFVFHLAYAYLRQRDLLSLFPLGALLAALGAVWLIEALRASAATPRRALALAAALFGLAYGLGYRSIETFHLPVTRGFGGFGYLVPAQRASFDALRSMTPEDAVIAASLNSGAIDLHARRATFRPATWTADQLLAFVSAVRAEGRPVYVVDESNELASSVATLRARFTLAQVGAIDVPYYFLPGGGSENRRVPVFRVE